MTSLSSSECVFIDTWTYFPHCRGVFIVDFKKKNSLVVFVVKILIVLLIPDFHWQPKPIWLTPCLIHSLAIRSITSCFIPFISALSFSWLSSWLGQRVEVAQLTHKSWTDVRQGDLVWHFKHASNHLVPYPPLCMLFRYAKCWWW